MFPINTQTSEIEDAAAKVTGKSPIDLDHVLMDSCLPIKNEAQVRFNQKIARAKLMRAAVSAGTVKCPICQVREEGHVCPDKAES